MAPIVRLAVKNDAPALRQTPGNSGKWKDLQFVGGDGDIDDDWLVVYDDPGILNQTWAPKERRIIFITEPPEVKDYYAHYLNQFGIAVSPMRLKGFEGVWLQQHGSLLWFIGPSYDELQAANYEDKSFDLSIVCSAARKYEQHRRRFEFVTKLKEIFGDKLHWYGRGIQKVSSKAEAISPYRYSIALENNIVEHFWTEKLADVYLGSSFPFYAGGANLQRYFPEGAFEYIDLDNPRAAAAKIERAIETGLFEKRLPLIRAARQKILDDYNLCNEIWNVIQKFGPAAQKVPSLSKPERIFKRKSGLRSWGLELPRRVRRHFAQRKYCYEGNGPI